MSLPTYTNWTAVPPNLATKTQLNRDGLKLAPDQQPVAYKRGMRDTYALYDRSTAVVKRASSQAQQEAARLNIQKAQAALCCVDCGEWIGTKSNDGRCPYCRQLRRIERLRIVAGEWFASMASRDDWLIVDTETTGLHSEAEIVQMGIVSAHGRVLLNQLVRPTSDISPGTTAVHGLTADMLQDAPLWTAVYPEVCRLVEGKLLLAYNAEFDGRIISQTCRRYDLPTPPNKWECVMEMFAQWLGNWSDYWRDFRSVSLGEAAHIRGIGAGGAHEAGSDALTAWRVIQSFVEVKNE